MSSKILKHSFSLILLAVAFSFMVFFKHEDTLSSEEAQTINTQLAGLDARVEQVDSTPADQEVSEVEFVTYEVQLNDTLGEISERYNTTVEEIMELNNLENPDELQLNQQLIIYSSGEEQTTSTW
jgi:LysM repeat protein